MHPVVGEGDGLAELAPPQVDACFRVRLVPPVREDGRVKQGLHLPEGVIAILNPFGQEVGEGTALNALSDGVDEGPVSILVVDVELRPSGKGR